MKKIMQRFFGVLTSVALLVTSATPVFASSGHEHRADDKPITGTVSDGYTITLTTPSGYPEISADNSGDFNYGAYQIFYGTVKGTTPSIENPGGTESGGTTTSIPITDIKWGNAFGITGDMNPDDPNPVDLEVRLKNIVGFVIALAEAPDNTEYSYAFGDFHGFDDDDNPFIQDVGGTNYLDGRFVEGGGNVNAESSLADLQKVNYDKLAVEVADIIAKHNNAREWLQDFADILGGFASAGSGGTFKNDGYVSRYYKGTWDSTYKEYKITVPAGYYMILDHSVEGDADEAYSARMLFVAENITQVLKESVPTIDKTILRDGETPVEDKGQDTEVAGVGDIVTYQLKGTLPSNYDNYTLGYQYKFTDTLSKGLTIQDTDGVYVTVKAKGVYVDGTWRADKIITIEKSDIVSTGHSHTITTAYYEQFDAVTNTLTVEFPCLKEIQVTDSEGNCKLGVKGAESSEIYVTYKAMVNENAIVSPATSSGLNGNRNTATLTYSNNSSSYEDTGETHEDDATVYIFGLDIIKVDAADFLKNDKTAEDAALDGAKFVLVRPKTEPTNSNTEWEIATFKFISKSEIDTMNPKPTVQSFIDHGYYTIESWDTIMNDSVAVKGEEFDDDWLSEYGAAKYSLTTQDGGHLNISGLDVNVTYTMVETATPDDTKYAKIDPFTIKLIPEKDSGDEYTGKLSGATSDRGIAEGGSFSYENPVDITDTFPDDNGSANMLVANFKYIDLPSTGGVGTYLFYIIGGGIVVLSAVLFILSKKKTTK